MIFTSDLIRYAYSLAFAAAAPPASPSAFPPPRCRGCRSTSETITLKGMYFKLVESQVPFNPGSTSCQPAPPYRGVHASPAWHPRCRGAGRHSETITLKGMYFQLVETITSARLSNQGQLDVFNLHRLTAAAAAASASLASSWSATCSTFRPWV